jgi:hypothetical protein
MPLSAGIRLVFRAAERLVKLVVHHQEDILTRLTQEELWQWNCTSKSKGEEEENWAESLSLDDGEEGWERADERLEAMNLLYVRARGLRRVYDKVYEDEKMVREVGEFEIAVEEVIAAILGVVVDLPQD